MLWDPFLMKKLLKSVILWDSWTMHIHSWLVNNCRPNKKKKREREKHRTQNTNAKLIWIQTDIEFWHQPQWNLTHSPLPTPLGKTLLSSKKEKNVTKKIKKGTPLFISGQKYKAYGKIGEQDILYYAFRKKRKL